VGKSKTGKRRIVGDELLETKDILSMHQTRPVERVRRPVLNLD
jgi:hypothetical protein